jgi:two-component system invasion response regulator UvrY
VGHVVRILIADGQAIFRRGLKQILMRELDGATCGEAEDGQQVVDQVQNHDWDLLILDIGTPGRYALDVLGDLKTLRPELPVLVLAMHPQPQHANRVLKAGASGYMSKESEPAELIKAVRKLLSGGRYVSPELAEAPSKR